MGGALCKGDKSQRVYGRNQPYNTALSRWSDYLLQVRQAYRKPKHRHRPPRPPQKPARSSERLTISAPTLVSEASSDGWRTATLMVPEAQVAPVPPPRKKRKRNVDLNRSAVSMDDLNLRSSACLSKSTVSLPDTSDSTRSSSTLVVTPVLESRNILCSKPKDEEDKEPSRSDLEAKTEEEEEDDDVANQPEIIPIENETLFSSRTLLHSNLGYVDKLSAISEVSTESGFDDKTDTLKFSEGSGSVTSVESVYRETLNILAHIQDINSASQVKESSDVILPNIHSIKNGIKIIENSITTLPLPEGTEHVSQTQESSDLIIHDIQNTDDDRQVKECSDAILGNMHDTATVSISKENSDIREKTAVSKKEWLQNILKVDPEPYFMTSDDSKERRGSDGTTKPVAKHDVEQPTSLPSHLSLMTREMETDPEEVNNSAPSTPRNGCHSHDSDTNHSVLLDIIQNNKEAENKSKTPNFLNHREESIFLTNTKTNIIYKSLSSDKLTDDYGSNYSEAPAKTGNGRHLSVDENNELSLTSNSRLSDYSFQTPKLVESDSGLNSLLQDKRSNVVSSFDFREIKGGKQHISEMQSLNSASKVSFSATNSNSINGVETSHQNECKYGLDGGKHNDKCSTKETLVKKDSISSSRKSSITDSLHEFEISIYDMLKESKNNENSSDDEESLKTVK